MKSICIIGNPLGKVRRDVIRVSSIEYSRVIISLLQLGTDAILKYLRNRLTIDDGTNDQKTFDIPKPLETEEERKRRLYTEHHVVRSTGTFDLR